MIPIKLRWLAATRLQLALLFTLAVVLSQVISLWIVHNQNNTLREAVDRFHLLERTASEVELLNTILPQQRRIAIRALSKGRKGILLADTPWQTDPQAAIPDLQQRFANNLEFPLARVKITTEVTDQTYCKTGNTRHHADKVPPESCDSDLFLSAQLDDNSWLNFYFNLGPPSKRLLEKVAPGIILTLISVIVITSLTLNRITRPLQRLSQAAEKVGRGELCQIQASGPEDVKQTIHAFNEMQEKLNLYIKNRTHLMAAISHDLHTPITTMRLRVELLSESADKAKLLETLAEMEAITGASLDFARESDVKEVSKEVDINALLASICDDLHDAGLQVEYRPGDRLVYCCRAKALKRALANLISNGAIYGQQARVQLTTTAEQLQISIIDKGEGIPEDMHERIFEPFVRLEHSRNRTTGGTGLGMSIARTIILHHGGDIQLLNHAEGFTVRVTLPRTG